MLTTLKSVLRRAAERMQRRHTYDSLREASDHMLRDIGVTRAGLYAAVVRDRR